MRGKGLVITTRCLVERSRSVTPMMQCASIPSTQSQPPVSTVTPPP
jgi:hypothetical protein